MSNEIYEVTRDEYVGFLRQIKTSSLDTTIEHFQDYTIIKVYSKSSGTHLCSRVTSENEPEHYFVFNMPPDSDRVSPKPVAKLVLKTQEEVQAFFNILSKLSKGEGKND